MVSIYLFLHIVFLEVTYIDEFRRYYTISPEFI